MKMPPKKSPEPNPMGVSGYLYYTLYETSRNALAIFVIFLVSSIYSAEVTQLPTESPEILISFKQFVTIQGYTGAEFVVSNCIAHAMWFNGYSDDSPVYSVQYFDGHQWEDSPLGWCGNGMGRYQLAPHKAMKFTVIKETKEQNKRAMRAGISASSQRQYNKHIEKDYWSVKVQPKK